MLGKSCNTTPNIFKIGDKVCHYGDPDEYGVIVDIDSNLIEMGYPSTTCLVIWDGCDEADIQWTNKLLKVNDE